MGGWCLIRLPEGPAVVEKCRVASDDLSATTEKTAGKRTHISFCDVIKCLVQQELGHKKSNRASTGTELAASLMQDEIRLNSFREESVQIVNVRKEQVMKTIDREQLKQKRTSVTLINTLPEDKADDYKIEGSLNIPQDSDDFVAQVEQAVNGDKSQEIVVYCANFNCDSSTKGAQKLEAAGFTNVIDYEGGAEDWNKTEKKSKV
jgi:rhodanese-related sulfurtransferase